MQTTPNNQTYKKPDSTMKKTRFHEALVERDLRAFLLFHKELMRHRLPWRIWDRLKILKFDTDIAGYIHAKFSPPEKQVQTAGQPLHHTPSNSSLDHRATEGKPPGLLHKPVILAAESMISTKYYADSCNNSRHGRNLCGVEKCWHRNTGRVLWPSALWA